MYELDDFRIGPISKSEWYIVTREQKCPTEGKYLRTCGNLVQWSEYRNCKNCCFPSKESAQEALEEFIYSQKETSPEELPDGNYFIYLPKVESSTVAIVENNKIIEHVCLTGKKYYSKCYTHINQVDSQVTPATPLQEKVLLDSIEKGEYCCPSKFKIGQSVIAKENFKDINAGQTYKVTDILIGKEVVLELEGNMGAVESNFEESLIGKVFRSNWHCGTEFKITMDDLKEDLVEGVAVTANPSPKHLSHPRKLMLNNWTDVTYEYENGKLKVCAKEVIDCFDELENKVKSIKEAQVSTGMEINGQFLEYGDSMETSDGIFELSSKGVLKFNGKEVKVPEVDIDRLIEGGNIPYCRNKNVDSDKKDLDCSESCFIVEKSVVKRTWEYLFGANS